MLPFTNQIQIACDAAKFASRGWPASKRRSSTTTRSQLADLRERIRKTIEFIQSVPAAQIDGTEDKDVAVPRRDGPMTLKGEAYLKHFVLPNFFFHMTTTYALLRHNGVELGKMDFLGRAAGGVKRPAAQRRGRRCAAAGGTVGARRAEVAVERGRRRDASAAWRRARG